jgi:hypothetical protein
MIRRLIVPLILAAVAFHAGPAAAQTAFPAPLPGQAAGPASNASPFPPAPFPSNGSALICGSAFERGPVSGPAGPVGDFYDIGVQPLAF